MVTEHYLMKNHTMQDKKKDITPRNKNNQPHGYWQSYWTDGTLYYKCFYVNGIVYGYSQLYETNGKKTYYAR